MYTTRSHSYHMSHVYIDTICTTCSHRYHVHHMFTWIPYVPHVHTDIMCTTCLQRYYLYHMLTQLCVPCVYMDTMCSTRGSPFMLNSPFWPHTSFLYSKVESILLLYMSVCLSLSPTLLCLIWMSAGSDGKSKCLTAVKVSAHLLGYQALHLTSRSSRNQTLGSGDFNVCRALHTPKVPEWGS